MGRMEETVSFEAMLHGCNMYTPVHCPFKRVLHCMQASHDHPVHQPRLDGILLVCAYRLVGGVDWKEEADGEAVG